MTIYSRSNGAASDALTRRFVDALHDDGQVSTLQIQGGQKMQGTSSFSIHATAALVHRSSTDHRG